MASSFNAWDRVPPTLLIYETAVELSKRSLIVQLLSNPANDCRALNAACSSSTLMWRELSSDVQVIPVLVSPQTAPQPVKDASAQIVRAGSASNMFLPGT